MHYRPSLLITQRAIRGSGASFRFAGTSTDPRLQLQFEVAATATPEADEKNGADERT
jgi:hypothetical protein